MSSALGTLRAQFLVEMLDLEAATQVEGARWEHFQLAHLTDDSTFRIEVKSRQIAWSWLSAVEGLADAIIEGRSSIYVSINQDEAQEKIRYAKQAIEALPRSLRPKLSGDSKQAIELATNGARLISLAARPPRGKARANVYLDEFAHVRDDRAIYTGALPVISKGGRLRIGSSPLGASGVFWEVSEQKLRPYPGYTRKRTPWWLAQAFCLNVTEARKLAPALPTIARVELFGNDRIKAIYANLPEEDFQQEYEAAFVDESTAWISWEEIKAVQDAELRWVTASGVEAAHQAIDDLARRIDAGQVEQVLGGGLDIGRTRNTTELFLVGISTLDSYPLRLSITLDNVAFDDQAAVLAYALRQLPIVTVLIDRNGMGMNLAENAARDWPAKAQGVDFTQPSKVLWATDAKMLIQQRKTPLPADREIAYQIHSIKKTVTAAKNLVFDTARNEKHHADKFWAWALALHAAKRPTATDTYGANPFSGYRG